VFECSSCAEAPWVLGGDVNGVVFPQVQLLASWIGLRAA